MSQQPETKGVVGGLIILAVIAALIIGLVWWGVSSLISSDEPTQAIAAPTPKPTPATQVSPAPRMTPTAQAVPTPRPTVVSTLGVSLSKIQSLFENTGYQPFDRFSDTERSAMYFDGGGSAVIVSLYGYPNDIESIGVSFSGLNETMVVALTVEILIAELDPDWTDRVRDWVYDNYPRGGRKKIEMTAGTLVVTLDTGNTPSGSGWIAELLLERHYD